MPNFKIVIETGSTSIRAKNFKAEDMDEAHHLAAQENWDNPSWEEIDTNTSAEIRDDLCETIEESVDDLEQEFSIVAKTLMLKGVTVNSLVTLLKLSHDEME